VSGQFNASPFYGRDSLDRKLCGFQSPSGHGEGKVVSALNYHGDVWGRGGIDPRILNISARWRWLALRKRGA
jgi:hypothetical protein